MDIKENRGWTVTTNDEELAYWYHPSALEVQNVGQLTGPCSSMVYLDESKPLEERRKFRDMVIEQFEKAYVSPLGEELMSQFKIETLEVPGCPEEPDTKAKITYYIPPVKPAKGRKYPAMLYVCGGGMCMANPDMFSLPELAMKFKCVIVAPHYRTILDGGKYPDALNDLHAGYQWLYEHADELGVHKDKIIIHGTSSGAHQGICLCFRLKRYGFSPRGCVAAEPIVEDRPNYHSMELADTMWPAAAAHLSNKIYFGENFLSPFLGPEAFGNRATVEECKGLAPMFLIGNELDTQADPVSDFVKKTRAAGVFTEVHQYGGFSHGYTSMPYIGTRDVRMVDECLEECLTYDLRRK